MITLSLTQTQAQPRGTTAQVWICKPKWDTHMQRSQPYQAACRHGTFVSAAPGNFWGLLLSLCCDRVFISDLYFILEHKQKSINCRFSAIDSLISHWAMFFSPPVSEGRLKAAISSAPAAARVRNLREQ